MNANRTLPAMAPGRDRRRWPLALLAAFLLTTAAGAGEATDNGKHYQDDLRLLSTKVGQYRYRLKSSRDGAQQLAELDQALAKLKAEVDEIAELAGELDDKDSRLHYLKEMELGPKERDVDRVRQAQEQRYEQLNRQRQGVEREWAWWATQKHTFKTPDESAGLAAAWVQYNRIKALEDAYKADRARAQEEMKDEFARAVAAYTKAQQELSETETRREQMAEKLGQRTGNYAAGRAPIVEQLVSLDNAPAPVNVPLTPFSNGVPPEKSGKIDRVKTPIGPGANTHALDQLRVVTASSRVAAGHDDQDKDNGLLPPNVTASTVSSYEFDNGGGTGVAPLPEVAAPAAAVPLVLPPSPAEREDAPAPVKASPELQKLANHRVESVKKLDDLYAARRVLLQQGAAASPADWTKVVQDISATHAAIAMDVVTEKLAEGSQKIDAQVTLRPQRKRISDIVVPPPDTNPASPPPK